MDRARALAELPGQYAIALRLHEAGVERSKIAAGLGVPAESVGPLLQLAEAKLQAALQDDNDCRRWERG